jgi:hypothetical protein
MPTSCSLLSVICDRYTPSGKSETWAGTAVVRAVGVPVVADDELAFALVPVAVGGSFVFEHPAVREMTSMVRAIDGPSGRCPVMRGLPSH